MALLNIIIPTYNEEQRIITTLKALASYVAKGNLQKYFSDFSLIIVDDGSTDQTVIKIKELLPQLEIKAQLLNYSPNRGKGYAIRHGVLNSNPAEYYFIADADLASSWEEMEKFFKIIESNPVTCVIGSRALPGSSVKTTFFKKTMGRMSNKITNILLGLKLTDTQCGYKLYSKACTDLFRKAFVDRWGGDFELLYLIKKNNLEIVEVPLKWQHVEDSRVKLGHYLVTFIELLKIKFHKYT